MNDRHDTEHAGRVEAHRLDGFFDAAFAFAVSVMAIAGTETPNNLHDLLLDLYRIPGFACSFATLMLFWHRHVHWRDRFRIHDSISIKLTLTLVFSALIFVYPLNMLFQALFTSIYQWMGWAASSTGPDIASAHDLRALYICYAAAYICMASCLALLYHHSLRRTSLAPIDTIKARETLYGLIGSSAVAALSLLSALVIPMSGAGSGVPGYIYFLLTLVYWIIGRWSRKAEAAVA